MKNRIEPENFADYMKKEDAKSKLLDMLVNSNIEEEAKSLDDDDLERMIMMLYKLDRFLNQCCDDSDAERADVLIAYIVGLWATLKANHGIIVEDL